MPEAASRQARSMLSQRDRIRQNSDPAANARIDRKIEEMIRLYAGQPKESITRRIEELEQEWDIERALQMTAAVNASLGLLLGTTVNRKWLLLTAVNQFFLGQHAAQGWCPPLAVFRRLGIRTRQEIEAEKMALKMLRGDFDAAQQMHEADRLARPGDILKAVTS